METRKQDLEGLAVKSNKTGTEVSASYAIDDASLDILIRFPTLFPLRQVQIEAGSGKVAGVPESKWRAWLLSTTTLMVSQNGTLADALCMFQRNVHLNFEGIEDCAICKT